MTENEREVLLALAHTAVIVSRTLSDASEVRAYLEEWAAGAGAWARETEGQPLLHRVV